MNHRDDDNDSYRSPWDTDYYRQLVQLVKVEEEALRAQIENPLPLCKCGREVVPGFDTCEVCG